MKKEWLIAHTTREERERLVEEALGFDGGCEDGVGGLDMALYQPYIDGEMELDEVTRGYRARIVRADGNRPPRMDCGMGV